MEKQRSKEEQQVRDEIIDSLVPAQVMSTMVEMFGIKHTITLVAWAIRWGVLGIENTPPFRQKLLSEGISRATAYRSALELQRVGDELVKRYGGDLTHERLHGHIVNSDLAAYCLKDSRLTVL